MQLGTAGSWKKRLIDYVVYLLARLFITIIQALPLSACATLADWGAILLHDRLRIRRSVIEDNLRFSLPELNDHERDDVARQMFQHLLLMICEIAHAPRKIHETNWRQHVTLVNPRPLVRAMIASRAVVAVTAHHGNFEMNGYISGLFGFPTFTLARTLDNPHLHRFLSQFRGATGQHILPTKDSAALAEHVIEANESLAVLADHYGGPKGCWIEYFNRPASCHKAIALFCLAQDAPMVLVHTERRGNQPLQFNLVCDANFDPRDGSLDRSSENAKQVPFDSRSDASQTPTVKSLTQWYSGHIESFVREMPGQYWWLHRRWKDTRAADRENRLRRRDKAEPPCDGRTRSASSSSRRGEPT